MGSWSWMCKGACGRPICEGEEVVGLTAATYEGYGKVGEDAEPAVYHRACFRDLAVGGAAQLLDFEPGDADPDQGFGHPDPRFVPEGTVLFEPALQALAGKRKLGLIVSTRAAADMQGLTHALRDVEQACHYTAVQDALVFTFEGDTLTRGGMDARRVSGITRGDLREGFFEGGGETDESDPREAIAEALDSGCDVLVVVSDGVHEWPSGFDAPTVHVRLVDPERGGSLADSPEGVAGAVDALCSPPLTDEERRAIEERVVAEQRAASEVAAGAKIVVRDDVAMSAVLTKHKEPLSDEGRLHKGKFIVDWVRDGKAHLADAEWDDGGAVTFHSSKHGHIVALGDLVRMLRDGRAVRVRFGGE